MYVSEKLFSNHFPFCVIVLPRVSQRTKGGKGEEERSMDIKVRFKFNLLNQPVVPDTVSYKKVRHTFES